MRTCGPRSTRSGSEHSRPKSTRRRTGRSGLSGGEQQRLGLARALLARPEWLFLDEATSALDDVAESGLYKVLIDQLPKTAIVSIAHRATLEDFHDRRVEMTKGPNGIFHTADAVARAAE